MRLSLLLLAVLLALLVAGCAHAQDTQTTAEVDEQEPIAKLEVFRVPVEDEAVAEEFDEEEEQENELVSLFVEAESALLSNTETPVPADAEPLVDPVPVTNELPQLPEAAFPPMETMREIDKALPPVPETVEILPSLPQELPPMETMPQLARPLPPVPEAVKALPPLPHGLPSVPPPPVPHHHDHHHHDQLRRLPTPHEACHAADNFSCDLCVKHDWHLCTKGLHPNAMPAQWHAHHPHHARRHRHHEHHGREAREEHEHHYRHHHRGEVGFGLPPPPPPPPMMVEPARDHLECVHVVSVRCSTECASTLPVPAPPVTTAELVAEIRDAAAPAATTTSAGAGVASATSMTPASPPAPATEIDFWSQTVSDRCKVCVHVHEYCSMAACAADANCTAFCPAAQSFCENDCTVADNTGVVA